eukprot:TRINITY_DN12314_c0_g1_i1.p1 TRINITY_DN12314_c0_g1~~TRINITY_DN12314_c0_g1_i1.p1  ORF type:complete len:353 (+),score=55.58 TRINITY_DN12314_c0_g1_i1:67-1059(+)
MALLDMLNGEWTIESSIQTTIGSPVDDIRWKCDLHLEGSKLIGQYYADVPNTSNWTLTILLSSETGGVIFADLPADDNHELHKLFNFNMTRHANGLATSLSRWQAYGDNGTVTFVLSFPGTLLITVSSPHETRTFAGQKFIVPPPSLMQKWGPALLIAVLFAASKFLRSRATAQPAARRRATRGHYRTPSDSARLLAFARGAAGRTALRSPTLGSVRRAAAAATAPPAAADVGREQTLEEELRRSEAAPSSARLGGVKILNSPGTDADVDDDEDDRATYAIRYGQSATQQQSQHSQHVLQRRVPKPVLESLRAADAEDDYHSDELMNKDL